MVTRVRSDSGALFKVWKASADKEQNKDPALHTKQQCSNSLCNCSTASGRPLGQKESDVTHPTLYEGKWSDAHPASIRRQNLKKWILSLFVVSLSVMVTPANTSTLPWGSPGTPIQSQNGSTADLHDATRLVQYPFVSAPLVDMDEKGSPASF